MNIETCTQPNIQSFTIHLKDYVDIQEDDDCCIEEYHSIKSFYISPNHKYIAFIVYRCEVHATCSTIREYFIVIHNMITQEDVYTGEWQDCETDIFCEFTEDSQYFLSEAKYSYILINTQERKARFLNKKKRGELLFLDAKNIYFHKDQIVIYSLENKNETFIPLNPTLKLLKSLKVTNSFYIYDLKSLKVSLLWKITTQNDLTYQLNKYFLVEQTAYRTILRYISNKKIIRNNQYTFLPYENLENNQSVQIIKAVFNRVKNKKQKPITFMIRVFDVIKGTTKVNNSIVKRKIKPFNDVKITEQIYLELYNEQTLKYSIK